MVAPTDSESTNCAICSTDNTRVLYRKRTPSGRVYPIVQCKSCGLVYVNPRQRASELLAIYRGKSYFQRPASKGTGYANYTADRELHVRFFRRQLETIEGLTPKGELLDVGCAFGFLLEEARSRGWQTTGIELSEFAADFARTELGLHVLTGTLREVGPPAGGFDAILMDDVIEHSLTPIEDLRIIHRSLRPGGVFVLHTPNVDSLWHKLMRSSWVHLKPEEHLYYFAPKTLSTMVAMVGLNVVSARACSKVTNARYIIGVMKKYSRRLSAALHGLARLVPRLAAMPFWFPGGGMELVAVKPR